MESENLNKRVCFNCGTSLEGYRKNSKTCKNPECKKAYNNWKAREKYNSSLIEKECDYCGEIFLAKTKQTRCKNCSKKRDTNVFKKVEQKLVCTNCGKVLEIVLKNKTKDIPEILPYKVCDECKKSSKEARSECMKLNNPSYEKSLTKKEYIEKQKKLEEYNNKENKLKRKKIFLKRTSERMRKNNPMFKEEVVGKMRKTFKENISNGKIIYKKGKEHHLYKGNRNFNKQVRIELREWVRKKMELDNFTCTKCGKTNCELQVHHLEPLRNIIIKFLEKYNIALEEFELGDKTCLSILKDIKEYHFNNFSIGITVCQDCHSKLDKHYKQRKIKKYKNEN